MSSFETRPDPVHAAILAKVERRQAMLEELADLGMALARQVNAHVAASMSAINEDHGGDPTRAFATISRTIRLTLTMEARLDAQILALRNGRVPRGWSGTALPSPTANAAPRLSGERREGSRERLVDTEDEEAFLALPFEESVDALRRDLEEAELEFGAPGYAPDSLRGTPGSQDAKRIAPKAPYLRTPSLE